MGGCKCDGVEKWMCWREVGKKPKCDERSTDAAAVDVKLVAKE